MYAESDTFVKHYYFSDIRRLLPPLFARNYASKKLLRILGLIILIGIKMEKDKIRDVANSLHTITLLLSNYARFKPLNFYEEWKLWYFYDEYKDTNAIVDYAL